MSCEYEQWGGAYVLGSLSPTERAEFQRHLAECGTCTDAVQEMAGLPGLLARVPADVLEQPPEREAVPDTLLPGLVRAARRTQRRRLIATTLVAAATTAAVVTGVTVGLGGDNDGSATARPAGSSASTSPGSTASAASLGGRRMVPAGKDETYMSASLSMSAAAWGTRLGLTCRYQDEQEYHHARGSYALVVRDREGAVEQVATWSSMPGKTMHLTAATSVPRGDITAVEVRTAGGQPVLRLQP